MRLQHDLKIISQGNKKGESREYKDKPISYSNFIILRASRITIFNTNF